MKNFVIRKTQEHNTTKEKATITPNDLQKGLEVLLSFIADKKGIDPDKIDVEIDWSNRKFVTRIKIKILVNKRKKLELS